MKYLTRIIYGKYTHPCGLREFGVPQQMDPVAKRLWWKTASWAKPEIPDHHLHYEEFEKDPITENILWWQYVYSAHTVVNWTWLVNIGL